MRLTSVPGLHPPSALELCSRRRAASTVPTLLAGTLHSVVMQPGDMVMYEGASCAHGREEPLKGRYFANAFIHFKPK